MAQADYVVSNGTGAAVRADLNGQLAAIVTNNSGATSPATTYAYQWWADTTTNTLKLRNSANSAWIEIMQLDGTLTMEDGTAALPGLAFRDDLDTGIFRAGTNQLGISSAGVERVEFGSGEVVFNDSGANYDFRVEGDTNANLLFVDASADAVGIGTSSPSAALHVTSSNAGGYGGIFYNTSSTGEGLAIRAGSTSSHNIIVAQTYDGSASRFVVNAAGNVGIGVTSPQHLCQIAGTLAVDSYNDTTKTITLRPGFEANANGGMGLVAKDHSGSAPDGLGIYGTDGVSVHTANAGTFFERFRVDTSGRLLVGTSTARDKFFNTTFAPNVQLESTGSGIGRVLSIVSNSSADDPTYLIFGKSNGTALNSNTVTASGNTLGVVSFQGADGTELVEAASISAVVDATPGANDMPGRLVFSTTADGASSPTERMRINSAGLVAINTASKFDSNNVSLAVKGAFPATPVEIQQDTTSNHFAITFRNANGLVGSITTSGSATSFNTSSDYRLKENVEPVADGITRLQQLKPSRFNFIADPDKTVDGFIAHEVQAVVPEAIYGEKDEVDNDGKPVYQGIDQSKLVPLLTAALQEAIGEIESLKARVAALESA